MLEKRMEMELCCNSAAFVNLILHEAMETALIESIAQIAMLLLDVNLSLKLI